MQLLPVLLTIKVPVLRGVYAIRCINNGKVYVGQSVDIRARFLQHRLMLKGARHHNAPLQSDYAIHGEFAFEFGVVEFVKADNLLDRELYWITELKSNNRSFGYNIGNECCGYARDTGHVKGVSREYVPMEERGIVASGVSTLWDYGNLLLADIDKR